MIELRFMTEFQHLQKVIDAKESFEQVNPNVRIMIEQSTDHFESRKAFESDEAPDMIESGGWALFNNKTMFVDLNPYVAEIEGLEGDLCRGPMYVARHNGMLPGLPVDISVPLILFNKAMFDRAGLAYPQEGWTWEEFIELGKKLTNRTEQGVATQFGFGIGVDIEEFEPFVFRNGGAYLAEDGSTARGYVDHTATIEAFRKLIDAFRLYGITRKPDEPSEAGQLHQGFAMIFGFMWFADGLIRHKIDEKFGVVGLPCMRHDGSQTNMIYMGAAGVTSKSRHPHLAWEFLRHYIIERNSWPLPLTRSQAERRGLMEHRIWSRYMKELDCVRPSGYYLNEKWNSSRQLINEDIRRMILEGTDVAQTMRSWTRFA